MNRCEASKVRPRRYETACQGQSGRRRRPAYNPAGFGTAAVGSLYAPGDAALTAHNILAHQLSLRLAVAGDVISVLYIVYTLLLFNLFRPVSRDVSLLAALFSLVGIAIGTVDVLFELAPLVVLNDPTLNGFTATQLDAVAERFLKLHAQTYDISLVLFGGYNMLIGYLIFRSTFMPRLLGALLAFAGLCYEINSFAAFLAPDFAAHLQPYILAPGLSEILIALWLTVFGVNEKRWNERATRSTTGSVAHPLAG